MKEYCPLTVISGASTKSGIVFQHPQQKITVSSHIDVVWAIVRFSDGLTKSDTVISKTVKLTGADPSLVASALEDLTNLEILVDSRLTHRHFHKLGNNLSVFSAGLTPDEVYALQMSPHLTMKHGLATSLDTSTDSYIGRLGSKRTSCRSFSNEPLKMSQFSEMLRVAYAKSVTASPSAGGLYPLRIYVLLTKPVDDLETGIYEYDSENNAVVYYENQLDSHELEFALNSDSLLYNAPAIFVVCAEIDRQPTKYANRGYRYSLIEAGHVAQNIHLVGHELSLSTLEYCGFQDDKLSDALDLDDGIIPILTVAVGYAKKSESDTVDEFAAQLATDLVGKGKPVNWVHLVNSPQSEEDYSFFHFVSHFRSGDHDVAKLSYKDRLCGGTSGSFNLAMVKAIAEGYERYQSSVIRVDAISSADSFSDDTQWLDPRVYAPYTEAQINHYPTLTPFQSNLDWEWTEGDDLVSGSKVMVPIDLVYYPLSRDILERNLCHYANSSGIAAHSTYDAAVKGALLELIERDAIMRNWFEKTPPSRIAMEHLPLHWRKRVEHWSEQGHQVDVVDLSNEGVSIINVVIHSDERYPHFVTGTSASIDSLEAAYTKAFHEAELTLITLRQEGEKVMSADELAQPIDHGIYYAQKAAQGAVDFLWSGCYSTPSDPGATLELLIDRHQPCVVNLSGRYQGLQVVRVFARDLVPVNFGYGVDHYTHQNLPVSIRKKHFSELEPHYLA